MESGELSRDCTKVRRTSEMGRLKKIIADANRRIEELEGTNAGLSNTIRVLNERIKGLEKELEVFMIGADEVQKVRLNW